MTQAAVDPHRWVSEHTARAEDLGRRARHAQEAVAAARGRAEGAGGAVQVEVGPGGRLEHLELDDRALRLAPEVLARTITDAVRSAHHATTVQVQHALRALVGESGALDFVRELGATTGAEEPSARAEPAPARTDDEDFGGSVLR